MNHSILINNGKSKYTINVSTLLTALIIILCGGWSDFIPLTFKSIINILIGFTGLFFALNSAKKSFYTIDCVILSISIGIPIISSIMSNFVFGQPIFTGLLSLRLFLNLLIIYYLLKNLDPNKFIHIVCQYQIFIMIVDTILLYVFNIDSNRILSLQPTDDNAAYVKSEAVDNELRGLRLSLGTGFTLISMAYWSAKYYFYRNRKNLICMFATLLFVFFVSKSRVNLLICFLTMLLPLFYCGSFKDRIKLVIILIISILISLSIPAISQRFLVISDLFGETKTQGTGDFSGIARLNEILVAMPYILKYPIFGVGNISYHFKGGFEGVLGEYFFLADIGIIGMAFMGGLFFCSLYYYMLYLSNIRNLRNNNLPHIRIFNKIIITLYAILPLMGKFIILADSTYLALIITLSISPFWNKQFPIKNKQTTIKNYILKAQHKL